MSLADLSSGMSRQALAPEANVAGGSRGIRVSVVGGGPAGLMAAARLLQAGAQVDLFDAMPSVGRKFLLAGKGGLNLTHSEPMESFVQRYDARAPQVGAWLAGLTPLQVREWAHGLGVSTFVGSSGRVFPAEMKAAPLLRAWLHRLRQAGLQLHMRHRWQGWGAGDAATTLRFDTPDGERLVTSDAVVLALGGASWPQLGSDGAWVPWLTAAGASVAALKASNCGFDVGQADGTAGWSAYFAGRFAGTPLKTVGLRLVDLQGQTVFERLGEFVVTATGIEGSLVYAASAPIRDAIERDGSAQISLDLLPGRTSAQLAGALGRERGQRSLPRHLALAGLDPVRQALLRERWSAQTLAERLKETARALADSIKAWPLRLVAARPVAEAISTAGGVRFESLDGRGMIRTQPGVFCAGEMLDWEAPTGGYLLSACLASGQAAADGVMDWLGEGRPDRQEGADRPARPSGPAA